MSPGKPSQLLCAAMLALCSSACATRQPEAAIQSTVLTSGSHSWDGAALPAYPTGTPEIYVVRIAIPPGMALPMHRHPVINAGVLLSGELTVTTADQRQIVLSAGDGLLEVVNTWHYGRNTGNETAEIIVVYAGTAGVGITELQPTQP